MASDSELAEYLGQVLRTADLTTTTNAILRMQLEEHFGVDLSGKKAFIRQQVDLYLKSLENDAEGDADGAEQDEEAEGGAADAQNGNGSDGRGEAEEGEEEEDEGDDDDEEDENGAGSSNGKNRKKKGSNKSDIVVKKKGGGFTKLMSLSPQLQKFVGESELARTEVVKRIWAYIREHNLQDPSNKRKILCDEELFAIFNVKSIDMFQMNKVLSKHIWPLDSGEAGSTTVKEKEKEKEKHVKRPKKRAKEEDEEEEEDDEEDEPSNKEKRKKSGTSGFLAPRPVSDALVKFIGTGATAMSRSDVVKRMWDYIKENKLQDPSDKRRIICDAKLKELFQVDCFTGFTVAKLLAPHFIKPEK